MKMPRHRDYFVDSCTAGVIVFNYRYLKGSTRNFWILSCVR